jgi:outer membrane protein OmpA-like peptidoglycan-associated protein
MKRFLLTLAVAASVVTSATAREAKVTLSRLSIKQAGGEVTVSFRASVARRLGENTRMVVISPVIRDDTREWSFPPVVIQRRKGNDATGRVLHAREGEVVIYRATAPFQQWMEGAKLVMEHLEAGWDDAMKVNANPLIDHVSFVDPPNRNTVTAPPPSPTGSTADRLAKDFPYLIPLDEGQGVTPEENPAAGLNIFFRQSSSRLEPERGDNWETLSELVATIRAIEYSGNSRVKRVLVAGFTSPEGSLEENCRLAGRRGREVKAYILRHTGLPEDAILVRNGAEDWTGLRALVERSRMPGREQVLNVIDRVPVWDPVLRTGREGVLKQLNGGKSYRYMAEYFFPLLRHTALVWVYYTNER